MPKEGDLQVWWTSNGQQKRVDVKNIDEAKGCLKGFGQAEVDNEDIIWNAGGLEVYENGEWCEWYSEDGLDIREVMEEEDYED
jgi:hypothetical protein